MALLQSHQDTCAVSLLCTWFWEVSANPVEKYFGLWHFCRAIKILVQYLHYAHGFGGISANPVKQNFGLWHFCRAIKILVQYLYYAHGFGGISANPVEKIYIGLWHFCRAIKILVQYLYYAHGFGGISVNRVEKVLDCGTSAEPSRYLYSIFTMHMVLGGSLPTLLKKIWTVALLQSHKDTCAVSLLCAWFWRISVNPVEKSFGLWHFCRAIKILVQYLYYAYGFGGGLCQPC